MTYFRQSGLSLIYPELIFVVVSDNRYCGTFSRAAGLIGFTKELLVQASVFRILWAQGVKTNTFTEDWHFTMAVTV